MKVFTTLCFLAIISCLHAQENSSSSAFREAAQQLSNNIMVIFQDSRDVYWFGSWEDGLYSYDGDTVIHYTTLNGLRDNRIESIQEDKHGNLYFDTPAGLSRFNGLRFKDINLDIHTKGEWQLSPDDLWFKGRKDGVDVCRYDGSKLHGLKMPTTPLAEAFLEKYRPQYPRMSNPYAVYTIYRDRHGFVWFGTAAAGACRFDGKNIDWIDDPDVNELHLGPANGVRSIIEDVHGKFWLSNSLYQYDVSADIPMSEPKMKYTRDRGIGSLDGIEGGDYDKFMAAARDSTWAIWIAMYGGGAWKCELNSSDKAHGYTMTHYPIMEGDKVVTLFYVYHDNHGGIWLGTHEHGAYKFNGTAFERFTP